jgi:endonuclease I
MQKNFTFSVLLLLLCSALLAQTNPTPLSLPVNENFGTAAFNTPRPGMASWTGGGTRPYNTQAAAEASTEGTDVNISNATPVSAGAGGQYGHAPSGNGRLTILGSSNSTNGTTQSVIAVNTSGASSVTISYDLILTIANAREIGLAVQYRVGTTGVFTTLTGSGVTYTSTSTNGGDADGPTDFDNYSFALPAAALGQANVQIRFITWRGAIAGSSSGIGLDNLAITNGAVNPCTEPTAQPTALSLTPSPTTINGSFTGSNPIADEYLVVQSTSSSLSVSPTDGSTYAPGQVIGNGTVVAVSSATTFTSTALNANTTYYYFVFALNNENCSGGPNYLTTSPLSASTSTLTIPACVAPLTAPVNLSLTPLSNSINGSFLAVPDANRYLVVRSSSATLSAGPANGITYTAGQSLGGGTIVNYGSTTSFTTGGLNSNTLYYIFVFAASGDCAGEPFYNGTALTGSATTTASGIPPGYYDATSGQTCSGLKTALFTTISSNTTVLSYTPGVWNAYQTTDLYRNFENTRDIIWDMYSDRPGQNEPYEYVYQTNQCGTYSAESDCYNREHSFPRSWFGGAISPMNTDLHHLFPTDGWVNNLRSSFPYSEVAVATTTSQNGSKLGANSFPGAPGGNAFEPINEYKGDFARAHLYMATRYQNLVAGWETNSTESNQVLNGTTYQAFENWQLQLLFKWHQQDPVSAKEVSRNNAIYALQGNRNPFVDNPNWVFEVWACTGLLPVTIENFYSLKKDNSIILTWQVSNETGFKQYEIERGTDGRNFETIGTVDADGRSIYNFIDGSLPKSAFVFYRMKLVDKDGSFTYSRILFIRTDRTIDIQLYPNPSAGAVVVQFDSPLSADASIQVIDVSGRLVLQTKATSGSNKIMLNGGSLAAGRYTVRIVTKQEVLHRNFVIQH